MARHSEIALAKINLALHVTARLDNGYHELDSLVAFAAIGDHLDFTPADKTTLRITGPFGGGLEGNDDNLIIKAVRALDTTWPGKFPTVDITLHKNLPVAAGIGGGSADAAAAIRGLLAMAKFTPPPGQLADLAVQLGADVPVCLAGESCQMRGIGGQIDPVLNLPNLPGLLINPRRPVATEAVFKTLGLKAGQAGFSACPALPEKITQRSILMWLTQCRNDLQSPALVVEPVIAQCLKELENLPQDYAPSLSRMSGSGATCFALFQDMAMAAKAAQHIQARHRDWWVVASLMGTRNAESHSIQ